jgi:hypothetical protein
MLNNTETKFYAIFNNGNDFELWSKTEGCNTRDAASAQAEMLLLDTYGSRDPKYMTRLNNMIVVNQDEANYLKLLN